MSSVYQTVLCTSVQTYSGYMYTDVWPSRVGNFNQISCLVWPRGANRSELRMHVKGRSKESWPGPTSTTFIVDPAMALYTFCFSSIIMYLHPWGDRPGDVAYCRTQWRGAIETSRVEESKLVMKYLTTGSQWQILNNVVRCLCGCLFGKVSVFAFWLLLHSRKQGNAHFHTHLSSFEAKRRWHFPLCNLVACSLLHVHLNEQKQKPEGGSEQMSLNCI